jgi:hypothetical protein
MDIIPRLRELGWNQAPLDWYFEPDDDALPNWKLDELGSEGGGVWTLYRAKPANENADGWHLVRSALGNQATVEIVDAIARGEEPTIPEITDDDIAVLLSEMGWSAEASGEFYYEGDADVGSDHCTPAYFIAPDQVEGGWTLSRSDPQSGDEQTWSIIRSGIKHADLVPIIEVIDAPWRDPGRTARLLSPEGQG